MNSPPPTDYGTTRNRAASVSYADIEAVARQLMGAGEYASVAAVRKQLKRGSTTTIADAMRRFWKNQAAMNAGDPVALTRLPPELADAAVAQWEQALRLAQQTASGDNTAASDRLKSLRHDTDLRLRSMELREKEWDMAARVRERALTDAREQINLVLKELSVDRAELRSRDARIADLDAQIESYRQQLATVITRAVARNRATQRPKQKTNRTRTKGPRRPRHAKPRKPLLRRPARKVAKAKRSRR